MNFLFQKVEESQLMLIRAVLHRAQEQHCTPSHSNLTPRTAEPARNQFLLVCSCFLPLEGQLQPTKPQRPTEQPQLKGKKKSSLTPRAMTVHWLFPRLVKGGCAHTTGQSSYAVPPSQLPSPHTQELCLGCESGHGSCARSAQGTPMHTERVVMCPTNPQNPQMLFLNGKDQRAIQTQLS